MAGDDGGRDRDDVTGEQAVEGHRVPHEDDVEVTVAQPSDELGAAGEHGLDVDAGADEVREDRPGEGVEVGREPKADAAPLGPPA